MFGKIDLIPNKVNHIWFNPDKAGMYVGQCAQFCGVEHAKMLLMSTCKPRKTSPPSG